MKISKKSWHYRLNREIHYDVSKSICGYFWSTLAALILAATAVAVVGFFILLVLSPILVPAYNAFIATNFHLNPISTPFLRVILATEIIVGLICLILYLKEKNSFTKVIFEYLKSIKTKVCPLINFIDEDAA